MEAHTFPPPAGTTAGPQQPSAGTGNHSASVLSAAVGHGGQGRGREGQPHNTHENPNTHTHVFIYAYIHTIVRKLLFKSSEPRAPWGHSCSTF